MVESDALDGLFHTRSLPEEPDLLSIDVDGIDYWLWHGLVNTRPRVVVIEYNARIPASISWCQSRSKYKADVFDFPGGGASLKALEILGHEKGYELVGCGFTGCNAFFVRKDQAGDHFPQPSTAEAHFEPFRDFLIFPHFVE